jgi:adenosylhomocysteine nucleosidase
MKSIMAAAQGEKVNKPILLVMALPQENAGGRLDDIAGEIIYTGVGKVNATLALCLALQGRALDKLTVINLGSAGSHAFKAGEVVCATRFFQHDMDATAMGFALGQTPFEDHTHLENGIAIPGLPQATCYTGDSFVTEKHPTLPMEIIDMEAYALAKVCAHHGLPFVALKFITDGADGQAASEWSEAVVMSAEKLHVALERARDYLRS